MRLLYIATLSYKLHKTKIQTQHKKQRIKTDLQQTTSSFIT